jgi:hypothetical protein
MLAQITAPYFCAGIVLRHGRVAEAAPIVKFMLGWSRDRVRYYCSQRGWKIVITERQ